MKLNESAFEKIESGKKTIEIRLYDDKYRRYNYFCKITRFTKNPVC